ncbi:hypothetical protein CSW37_11355 [Thermus scotoductus]|uniref:Uncharacterized protein n=2 Tax=Bacteria TaxID=2 RepID=A0A430RNP5_THESC|nr:MULTISPECIES: hypothetical protein [Thermus]ETN89598.1 hypothetical protein TNMX_00900 [Thermus sp. NMX2.A1]RTG93458.1 hypothetical protein CSW51_09375 [Thermus scotoductus]RTG97991.1 hypothetical protein CSW49_01890 [Thermus scotoductus]RTH04382.1 hypothetical protein CSW50_02835 [Thermus scotoductus]RTH06640.1 hypothetical protein CSW45_01550 [Thermus scotoductus]
MTDKAPYPWAGYDWGTLYRSLAHPGNRYRYALLIPGPPQAKPREVAHHRTRGTRLFRVPEGWLILSAHPEVRGLQLKDLSQHPIRTGPFLLTWGRASYDPNPRARLLVSPRWVREKARYVSWVTHGLTWPGGKVKAAPQVLKAVNQVTREIRYANRWGFLPPETARRWDKLVRRNLWRFLTSTAKLSRKEAKVLVRRALKVRYEVAI